MLYAEVAPVRESSVSFEALSLSCLQYVCRQGHCQHSVVLGTVMTLVGSTERNQHGENNSESRFFHGLVSFSGPIVGFLNFGWKQAPREFVSFFVVTDAFAAFSFLFARFVGATAVFQVDFLIRTCFPCTHSNFTFLL